MHTNAKKHVRDFTKFAPLRQLYLISFVPPIIMIGEGDEELVKFGLKESKQAPGFTSEEAWTFWSLNISPILSPWLSAKILQDNWHGGNIGTEILVVSVMLREWVVDG